MQAPGGNDDGLGTILILSIAQCIKHTGITFRSNVELVAFTGEEQGLVGSRAYASMFIHTWVTHYLTMAFCCRGAA